MTDADSRKRCICLHCGGHHGSLECPPTDDTKLVKRCRFNADDIEVPRGGGDQAIPEDALNELAQDFREAAEAIERLERALNAAHATARIRERELSAARDAAFEGEK